MGPDGSQNEDSNVQDDDTTIVTGGAGGGDDQDDTGPSELDAALARSAEYEKAERERKVAADAAAQKAALDKGEHEKVIADLQAKLTAQQGSVDAFQALKESTAASNKAALAKIPAAARKAIEAATDPFVQRDLIAVFQAQKTQQDVTVKKNDDQRNGTGKHPPAVLWFAKQQNLDPDKVAEKFPKLSDPNHPKNKGRTA